jgi:predicted glycogen debranching enzyme
MNDARPVRHLTTTALESLRPEQRLQREWLVTNGLGGYASGTVPGVITRRYHGLLIAAMPSPLGRVMLLNHLAERVKFSDGSIAWLGPHGSQGPTSGSHGTAPLADFRLTSGIPTWRYRLHGCTLERTLVMPHGQNTAHVQYPVLDGEPPSRLTLRPMLGFRPHDDPVDRAPVDGYRLQAVDKRIEVTNRDDLPPLRFVLHGARGAFTVDDEGVRDVHFLLEEQRGYEYQGPLWSPGYFRAGFDAQGQVTLIASAESWEVIAGGNPEEVLAEELDRRSRLVALAVPEARQGPAAELVLAADQFVIDPRVRAAASEDEASGQPPARTIIAGYHWFTDWGRDTMISLEGLTLLTGRHDEARAILHGFARHVRDGLVPNLFPEGGREGLYHTADATMWLFHAVRQYERYTGDTETVDTLLPVLLSIIGHHEGGTLFGIRMTEDGLLTQGAPGYQLTWMDAKVGDWVVTPRRGKAVEINALWYNALSLTRDWARARRMDEQADALDRRAADARRSFNARFWNAKTAHLFDVVDGEGGDDAACRPNQVFALSLEHPVLDREHWEPVMRAVTEQLLTPVGLRSLSPRHPDYKPRYFGDLRARDAAYHQGTVWGWLIGPYVDAWLALHPGDADGVRQAVDSLFEHLDDACLGSISEVFDADAPFEPRGCIAQAWSVAELLRAHVLTAGGRRPG